MFENSLFVVIVIVVLLFMFLRAAIKIVPEYERGVVFRLGASLGPKGLAFFC